MESLECAAALLTLHDALGALGRLALAGVGTVASKALAADLTAARGVDSGTGLGVWLLLLWRLGRAGGGSRSG